MNFIRRLITTHIISQPPPYERMVEELPSYESLFSDSYQTSTITLEPISTKATLTKATLTKETSMKATHTKATLTKAIHTKATLMEDDKKNQLNIIIDINLEMKIILDELLKSGNIYEININPQNHIRPIDWLKYLLANQLHTKFIIIGFKIADCVSNIVSFENNLSGVSNVVISCKSMFIVPKITKVLVNGELINGNEIYKSNDYIYKSVWLEKGVGSSCTSTIHFYKLYGTNDRLGL